MTHRRLEPGAPFEARYVIEGVLGEGGFATVYGARDRTADRLVAIKVLERDSDSGYARSTRARFEREVELLGRLRSPHTVRLFDVGETSDGLLFAIFEHVPGRDLAELLERAGRLDGPFVMHLLRQLLDSLGEAHRAGLLHRDIKPENVRVFERDGVTTAKLLDFGIARGTDDGHPQITKTGELIGTPRYMSPEQLTERPLGPASDIYSLGVMAFELLFGRDALGGHSWGAQLDRLHTGHVFSAPDLERVGPGLLDVIQRMTARDPAQRYGSTAAVLRALDHLGDGEPSARKQPTPEQPEPPDERPARRGAMIWIASSVAALIAIVAIVTPPADEPELPQRRGGLSGLLAKTAKDSDLGANSGDPAALDLGRPDAGAMRFGSLDLGRVELEPEHPQGGTSGCGQEPPFVGARRMQGEQASHPTYVPSGYRSDYKHPLLFLLHGDYENPADLLQISGFAELSEPDQFLVIATEYPNFGLAFDTWRNDEDDMELLREGLDLASERFCVDPKRVFVVGNSNAGRAAHFASCEDWVAGVATNSFASGNSEAHCHPPPARPFVLFTPTDSPHAPFEGGPSCTRKSVKGDAVQHDKFSVYDMEQRWVPRNGCEGERQLTYRSLDGDECYTWACETPLHSCHLSGGHGWPGSSPRLIVDDWPCEGPPAPTFPVAKKIWRVFREVNRPEQ